MSATKDPLGRAVELLVYAPIGAALFLKDSTPGFINTVVERGRNELDERVTSARSTGQVALAFGVPMLRERVQARVGALLNRPPEPAPPRRPSETAEDPEVAETRPSPSPPALVAVANDPAADLIDAPSSAELPIPGYDALSASQVVERLTGLAPSELDAVHAYEATHRQRRTILGKIEQLVG